MAITASAITSTRAVRFPGVCLNPTRAATLEVLGRCGINFSVDNMGELDGEIVGDVIANPSEPNGIELGKEAVRAAYEDIGSLLVLACLSDGLSEFDLGHLTDPESEGAIKLASEIASVTGAPYDTGSNRITIEGNPSVEAYQSPIETVSDYTARAILALFFKTPKPLDKERCLGEFGKTLTQVILGDLLF
jgi:hypothetical protein